jgi:hypothetical protein
MTVTKPQAWPSGQVIALVCIVVSSWMGFDVFLYSRNDHDMKLLALGAVIGQISALMATASTLLVGKVFDGSMSRLPNAADLPPGAKVSATDSVQSSPVTPDVPM